LGAFLGWLMAEMLVAMLTHVFDPPPDHLAVPWGFLAALGGAAAAAIQVAPQEARHLMGRQPLGEILRER
jgi:putative ABC transport system permease protein